MKNLYIARNDSTSTHSQIFDLLVAFDRDAAVKAAEEDLRHLTERERKSCSVYVDVFHDVVPDEIDAAKLADWYGEILDDGDAEWLWNPDETIKL